LSTTRLTKGSTVDTTNTLFSVLVGYSADNLVRNECGCIKRDNE
jgi:hypothetical protein